MLEVVFSDSTKGAMKCAKNYNEESRSKGAVAIGYIGKKPSKQELKVKYEGKPIGGSSQDVVCIGFSLDVGGITGEIDGAERQEVFNNIWGSVGFDGKETERFFQKQREDLTRLLTAANQGVPIRIWKSNAPYSICGFSFVCGILKNIDCKVSVVSLPECREMSDGTVVSYSNWGEISPGQLYTFLSWERDLSNTEKCVQANLWEDLKAENAPLRALVNGKLLSVPEDFYDHLLIKSIPEGEIIMARLIGNILGKYQLGVGDGWYALRIKKMIEDNRLKVVADKDPSHPYGKILMKTTI